VAVLEAMQVAAVRVVAAAELRAGCWAAAATVATVPEVVAATVHRTR